MRTTSKLLALALAAALQPAFASTVTLDFDDITTKSDPDNIGVVQLLDRYKTLGVQFTSDAWGVTSAACGGIWRVVPHSGCSALLLAGDPRDGTLSGGRALTLNFADGFVAGSSLYYSSLSSNFTVTLFDDLDGKGQRTVIDSALLTATPGGCTGARFCSWNLLNFDFTGVARSVVITGADESLMLDDLKFTTAASAPGNLPEPASIALAFSALGALGWARKRAAR